MKKIVIANWKMNPASQKEAKNIFTKVLSKAKKLRNVQAIISPPHIYLPFFDAGSLKLSAQDVAAKDEGPWTGEISAKMLKNLNVSYVIVGHSERRELGESDDVVHEKMSQVLSKGMYGVLCIGEKEKSSETFPNIVRDELRKALRGIPKRFAGKVVVAYEPVWAISSHSGGKSDTPQNFFEMSIFIRRTLLDIWGKSAAMRMPIIYGGSVNEKNAKGFLEVKGGAGVLVGKASLNPVEFNKILDIAENI